MKRLHSAGFRIFGVAAVLCCGATACSSSGGGAPATESFANTATGPAKLIPAGVRKSGSITIVTDATYPPYGYFAADGSTIEGLDADTAHAIEPLIGLQVKLVNSSFDNFIPGLKSNRYQGGFNGITDTADRRKAVSFVNFEKFGNYFLVPSSSDLQISSLLSSCGLTVGAEQGDQSVTEYQELAPKCKASGKPGPDVKIYPSQAAAISAMVSGRVKAILTGSNGPYLVSHSDGKYKITGPYLPDQNGKFSVGGLAVAKGSPVAPALLAALKVLYANGTLAKIYAKYGFKPEILINPTLDHGAGQTPVALP